MITVIGIDPGITGGLVVTNGESYLESRFLPIDTEGKEKRVSFVSLLALLNEIQLKWRLPVFLERSVSFGMGTKAAFNYGRGFEATVLAVQVAGLSLTLVEPQKWAKVMHAGISHDMRPKAKSLIAVKRLYPKLWPQLPTKGNGAILDGPMDALLIAGYGIRQLGGQTDPGDFY